MTKIGWYVTISAGNENTKQQNKYNKKLKLSKALACFELACAQEFSLVGLNYEAELFNQEQKLKIPGRIDLELTLRDTLV